jgi:hypothetical protein
LLQQSRSAFHEHAEERRQLSLLAAPSSRQSS